MMCRAPVLSDCKSLMLCTSAPFTGGLPATEAQQHLGPKRRQLLLLKCHDNQHQLFIKEKKKTTLFGVNNCSYQPSLECETC